MNDMNRLARELEEPLLHTAVEEGASDEALAQEITRELVQRLAGDREAWELLEELVREKRDEARGETP